MRSLGAEVVLGAVLHLRVDAPVEQPAALERLHQALARHVLASGEEDLMEAFGQSPQREADVVAVLALVGPILLLVVRIELVGQVDARERRQVVRVR